MTFQELREKYDKFIYEKYEINDEGDWWDITYFFDIPGLTTFTPSIKIDKKNIKNQNIDPDFVNYLVFHIGLVELISYWKCCCPKNVEIKAGYIDEDQIKWFKKMYFYGLGEFFYTNGIEVDEEGFMKITAPLRKGGKGGGYIPYNPSLEENFMKIIAPLCEGGKGGGYIPYNPSLEENFMNIIAPLREGGKGGGYIPYNPSLKDKAREYGIDLNEENFMNIIAPLREGGKGGGYIPYNPSLKDKARELRNNPTHAEKKLRYGFLSTYNYKFLRQKPIDEYIVDFFCNELKLIIEIDGDTHRSDEEIKHDELRTKKLESLGFKVIRFRNDEIYNNFDEVCNVIRSIEPPLSPFIRGTNLRPPFEGGVGEVPTSNEHPLSPFIRGTNLRPPFEGGVGEVGTSTEPPLSPFIRGTPLCTPFEGGAGEVGTSDKPLLYTSVRGTHLRPPFEGGVGEVPTSNEPPLSPFIRGTSLRPPFEGGVGEVPTSNEPPLSPFIRGTAFQGHGNLITVGGGKDSNVTLELLKGMDNDTFILNPNDVTLECSKIAGYDNPRIMKRILDPQIVELNQKGFLNGHTPFNALLAFLTYLVAYLGNKKYIVLSNESSANESNVRGLKVNHQYSKSFEFENDFNHYTEKYFGIGIKYFSFLRPLLEIQIAKLFSGFEQYHQVFKSCNVGSKSKPRKWCCNCPKCLFVYIILSPFLYKEKLINIFGEDLFENKDLLQTFIDLTGNSDNKPFECVGTYDEVNYAITLVIKKLDGKLPYLLQYYLDHFEVKDYDLLDYFNEENNLDPEFLEVLKKYL